MSVKLAIVYYSSYGTNYQMASIAAEAAKAAGAEVRLLKAPETAPAEAVNSQDAWKAHAEATADIPEATAEDMEWANAYLISSGTRFGVMASQMRAFIDTLGGVWFQGGLANKPVSAMTSAQNPHGGQETTLSSFYMTVMHWGGFVVAPGFTDDVIFKTGGNPYGYSHTQGAEFTDDVKAAIGHQARRLVEVAGKLA
ncbi:NAD(P)H:quinone oxidoreductase type IV [Marivita sp. S0852]|uniref:NAD(P)H:quinone oxidoreductase type IV n=1 Tax=Marivita sp. S0852 TaxID=3373893 RepID=UPI0039823B97